MAAAAIIETIILLAPLIEKIAGYLDDEHNDLPDVPLVLKSDIELKRMQARAKKKQAPPPLPARK